MLVGPSRRGSTIRNRDAAGSTPVTSSIWKAIPDGEGVRLETGARLRLWGSNPLLSAMVDEVSMVAHQVVSLKERVRSPSFTPFNMPT